MSAAGRTAPDPRAEPSSGDGDVDLLGEAERLIRSLTQHPDAAVRDATNALLQHIDAVHRTALGHLLEAIRAMGGEAFVNRLTADPAIRLLLMSYGLLAVDRRTTAEEALDAVRGHLHAHGVDVELLDVLGGVVTVRLHGVGPDDARYGAARRDIEAALREGLLGFQELEIGDGRRGAAPADTSFLPASALQRVRRPVYRDVCRSEELAEGSLRGAVVEELPVLLVRAGGELFAVRNACGTSPLPLDYSTLDGEHLRCSWHGCVYDVRTGARVDREVDRGEYLQVLAARERDGVIQVVVGTAAARTAPA